MVARRRALLSIGVLLVAVLLLLLAVLGMLIVGVPRTGLLRAPRVVLMRTRGCTAAAAVLPVSAAARHSQAALVMVARTVHPSSFISR